MANYIFDFDGTIADSFDYVIDWLSETLQSQKLAEAKRSEFRGLSMYSIARRLKAKPWRMITLLLVGRKHMSRDIDKIDIFDGMSDIIKQLHGQGHKLYIVSANSRRGIEGFLKNHDLSEYFSDIYGSAIATKAIVIRQLAKKHQIDRSDTWYIGDEAFDILSGHLAGVKTVAVTWGYNNLKMLAAQYPTVMAFEPDEIIEKTKADKAK